MSSATSLMARETAEIPGRAARQRAEHGPAFEDAGARLRRLDPPLVATVARGSSDHAATYLKALVELERGVPVVSLSPSVASVYGRQVRLRGAAVVAISQSGRSPDLIAAMEMARRGGAETYAVVNAPDAPLLAGGARALPIAAGPERAVAATKSFVGALTASAATVAGWAEDRALAAALDALPEALDRALAADWAPALDALAGARSAFVIGRGPSLAIAGEAALKLKETCELHAEAYSAAEVLHGPLQLAASGLVALVFAADDPARESAAHAARRLRDAGAVVLVADAGPEPGAGFEGAVPLPAATTRHALLDPASQVTSFYRLVERLARAGGRDPDRPSLLAKVTRTR